MGPLNKAEIESLFEESEISEENEFQVYPDGSWKKLQFIEQLSSISNKEFKEKTSIFDKLNKINNPVENIPLQTPTINDFKKEITENRTTSFSKVSELVPDITKTLIQNEPEKFSSDRTMVNTKTFDYLEKMQEEKEIKEKEVKTLEEEVKVKEEEEEIEENLSSNSTQFIDLTKLDLKSNGEVDNAEEELALKEKKVALKKEKDKIEAQRIEDEEDEEDEYEEDDEIDKNKKKKVLIYGIIVALVIMAFMPEKKIAKKDQKIIPIEVSLKFPVPFDEQNKTKSEKYYNTGLKHFYKFRFENLAKSAKYFRAAVEYNYKDDKSMAKLLLAYGELLEYSSSKDIDALTFFKMLQIKEIALMNDIDFITGKALFFRFRKKYGTVVKEIRKFLDVGNKPTLRLFSILLEGLNETGKFEKADEVYLSIKNQKITNPQIFVELIKFNIDKSDLKEAEKVMVKALESFPKSVPVLLSHAQLLLLAEDYTSLISVLKTIREELAENSKIYYAKYLEFYGLLNVAQKKYIIAKKFFKKSLELIDSPEIRSKIAALNPDEMTEVKDLILESKAIQFMSLAKNNMKLLDWQKAIIHTVNAIDIAPTYIPAKILLAQIQIRQGYYEKAITMLKDLYKTSPRNREVNFNLLDAYIEAYKFGEAKNLLLSIGSSDFRSDYLFYSYHGKMYSKMRLHMDAIKWYQRSINTNPINDSEYYNLSSSLFTKKYFNRSIIMIEKAIELSPDNPKYRVHYSKILYEQKGVDTAIGFLIDTLKDFPYEPILLSEVAINYFKSGQDKDFQDTKRKLKKLPNNDGALFEFLMEAALLDDNFDDVLKNGSELLVIRPGDLRTRMLMGEIYLERGGIKNLTRALDYFKEVQGRLSTYPKLKVNLSKLNILTGNIEKAKMFASEEIKYNPDIEDGYILLASIYRKENDYPKAQKFYQKALTIKQDSVKALEGIGFCHLKKNQLDIAVDIYNKAISLEPSNGLLRKSLGDTYRLIGQSGLAIKSYKVYLELEPNSKQKQEILGYMNKMN
ncbi:MAG: tetratricopeptide (TPR) repeat protein [Thermoproteota archaeon]